MLILAVIFGSHHTGHLYVLEYEDFEKVKSLGIFLLVTLMFDITRKIIKWYFGIGDIKLSPWDLLSNDYAMIT